MIIIIFVFVDDSKSENHLQEERSWGMQWMIPLPCTHGCGGGAGSDLSHLSIPKIVCLGYSFHLSKSPTIIKT